MTWPDDYINKIICGDALPTLKSMPDCVIQTCITSPPYWGLRDYAVEGQLGLEQTPEIYVEKMVEIFSEIRRVLKDDGTLWLNLGDTYGGGGRGSYCADGSKQATNVGSTAEASKRDCFRRPPGLKPKDLVGIPWMVAFALRADGWYLRSDIIWSKPNPMPESVTDRPTKAHEYLFLMSKSQKYYYHANAILEDCSPNTHARISQDVANQVGSYRAHAGAKTNGPMKAVVRSAGVNPKATVSAPGSKQNASFASAICMPVIKRNKRSVWTVATQPFKGAHFATFPIKLIEPCILAGSRENDIVFDPFMGSGTVAMRSKELSRRYIGIELNPEYIKIAEDRLRQEQLL